ncbi:MAG TPA: lipid-binding SYLF domain-containing protein, partial [Thermodesulfobacteriota bacterium]|nr:lipid-binding SYLF domain-containing protein [Thermodesulfobacteriota bacterium]
MESKKQRTMNAATSMAAVLVVGLLLVPYSTAMTSDGEQTQLLVDRARITLSDFMGDSNYSWLHDNIKNAKGVLIFSQVLKGGFICGGSGGTGVFLARDEKTGNWSEPVFYTVGSVTFGLQIGGEAAEVVMLAMTQKAIDSMLSTSFKLGGDSSVALGPVGAGAKAQVDLPSVKADFISFAKAKGLYGGLNLEGAVIAVRDSLNTTYCGRDVRPADIIAKKECSNRGADRLRE